MQVRHDIAQAGEVDFCLPEHLAHSGFDFVHHFHQFAAFRCRKVGNFGNVSVPNDAAECLRTAVVMDGDDAQLGGLQQNIFILCRADGAGLGGHFSLFLKVFKKR